MDERSFFSGKRFLITQPMIRSFCGSTMVTFELAEFLTSVGAEATVYTNVAFPPALAMFEKAGIKVLAPKDDANFSLNDYDYVWVHSLTFPCQLLEELKRPPKKTPAFVFLHMSPLETIPDEHPWIFDLENQLSSLSLYISEGTLESNKKFGLPPHVGFFRNPAPLGYQEVAKRKVHRKLRTVLVVSNHPPAEVLEAKQILLDNGIAAEIYGDGQDKYDPITPAVLKKYDAVVTIGKTVQFCIVGAIPVYIYDWYGGPGWLTELNYVHSRRNNFSGRFSSKKTGKEIAQEIMEGYSNALDYHLAVLSKECKEYIIDSALERVLKKIKPRTIKSLDSKYIESAKAAVNCAEIRFVASEERGKAYEYCEDLKKQVGKREREIEDCKRRIEQLEAFRGKYYELAGSKRMRFLDAILKPHDRIKGRFKKPK